MRAPPSAPSTGTSAMRYRIVSGRAGTSFRNASTGRNSNGASTHTTNWTFSSVSSWPRGRNGFRSISMRTSRPLSP